MSSALVSLLALSAAAPTAQADRPEAFVLIVANNAPSPSSFALAPLAYADDDGARYAEFFDLFARQVILHSVLDDETQRLHPKAAARALPPTLDGTRRSLGRLFEAIEAADRAGRTTELYFVFVGHGSTEESGNGALHFLDGKMTRSDLFRWVVAESPARYNHVIIDACHAFSMVAGRGADEDQKARIDAAVDLYLAEETMKRHPNTGFVLSTSKAAEVHEWSGFRAGVFSHEVRSALLGGADVDRDGRVTYLELQAFLQAANARVVAPGAKLEPWVRPPMLHHEAPLFARSWLEADMGTVRIGGESDGRWFVEDDRGVRLADLHVAPDGPVTLLLSPERDHTLHHQGRELLVARGVSRALDVASLPSRPATRRARGIADELREGLFAMPFGRAFFEGFRVAPRTDASVSLAEAPKTDATVRHWTGGSLLVAGAVALAGGIVVGQLAQDSAEDYRSSIGTPDALDAVRAQARERETIANILLGSGISGLIGGTALLVW